MSEQQPSHAIGKLLIAAILATGLLLAGFSWWFRYSATHRAVQFWGTEAAELIRDASHVELVAFDPPIAPPTDTTDIEGHMLAATAKDVSRAPGFTHLRNALLEDRSFVWSPVPSAPITSSTYALRFESQSTERHLIILFSTDCTSLTRYAPAEGDENDRPLLTTISCRPIAPGLRTIFAEQDNGASLPAQ